MSKLWLMNRVIEEEVTETPANEAIFYFNYLLRPELALTRLQLAELLLEHYPKEKSEGQLPNWTLPSLSFVT